MARVNYYKICLCVIVTLVVASVDRFAGEYLNLVVFIGSSVVLLTTP